MPDIGELSVGWGSEAMPRSEGDIIRGVVTELAKGYGNFDPYIIVIVRLSEKCSNQETGTEVAIHCFHTALANKMLEFKPIPGEKISVLYQGERDVKRPQRGRKSTFHSYLVKMEDRTQADFWDEAPAAQQPARAPQQQRRGEAPVSPTDVPWEDDNVPY